MRGKKREHGNASGVNKLLLIFQRCSSSGEWRRDGDDDDDDVRSWRLELELKLELEVGSWNCGRTPKVHIIFQFEMFRVQTHDPAILWWPKRWHDPNELWPKVATVFICTMCVCVCVKRS